MESFKESSPEKVFAYLADLVKQLDAVFGKDQYMLIGSYVRDIYLSVIAGKEVYRSTQDVDFSALVVSEEAFLDQLSKLGRQSGGKDSHHVTCRILDGNEIDVLPFSESFSDGIFRFKESEWDVIGHAEAYRVSTSYSLDSEGTSVRIPPIEALLGLKIIAWGMRGRVAGVQKDAQDFQFLLDAGIEILVKDAEIYEYDDALTRFDYLPEPAAAFVLGQKTKDLFSGKAYDRCLQILSSMSCRQDFFDAAKSHHTKLPAEAHSQYSAFLDGFC